MRNAPFSAYQDVPRPVIAIGNEHPQGKDLPAHRHRQAQLFYAEAGVVRVETPEGSWVAPPHRGLWIPSGVVHAVRLGPGTRATVLWFDAALSAGRGPRCQVLALPPLARALIAAAVDVPPLYDPESRDGLVMALLLAEVMQAPCLPLALPLPRSAALGRLCAAFLAAPSVKDTIDTWAAALHLDRRAFTRRFRRETGTSFGAWRQQACLLAALPRLAAGEAVTTVALDLGYATPAAFTTMFRRLMGVPPSRYQSGPLPFQETRHARSE